ncbi:FecR family protein [Pseudoxanthomonas indica]|uniref:FecR family protein n=1 Tax=Pseudoxanthomonas indica TaxID=428993 RepID=A0A1T5IXW4_9GAMM|nr:FecR domain-containing protein [Pseudoxanthomonas indica]GGD54907.1 iron dicitrate transporter FecR [Pseudoxanthomonas indica]SKC43763.1 FecR family protein [Pseudoxanthomonas indica]
MEERETSRDIDRIAAQWVARLDRAPPSASDTEQLNAWLAGDRRRRGAYLRAKALWLRSESAQALGPRFDPAGFQAAMTTTTPQPRPRERRSWVPWGGAIAASLLTAVTLLATLQMPTAYATAKGEMRTVPLGHGTTVTLNTDSRIQVFEDEGERRIRILRGEVLVERSSTALPTSVEVDGRRMQADSATFLIRKLAHQPTQILVQRGQLLLAAAPSLPLPLSSNTGVSLPANAAQAWSVSPLGSSQMGRELAWREGKIALQGETLAQAADIFARYSDTPIVITDPQLAKLHVAGLFAANNPLGFSHAIADVFDADVRQDGERIVLERKH